MTTKSVWQFYQKACILLCRLLNHSHYLYNELHSHYLTAFCLFSLRHNLNREQAQSNIRKIILFL